MSIVERKKKLEEDENKAKVDMVILFMKKYFPKVKNYKCIRFDEETKSYDISSYDVSILINFGSNSINLRMEASIGPTYCFSNSVRINNKYPIRMSDIYNDENYVQTLISENPFAEYVLRQLNNIDIQNESNTFFKNAYHLTFNTTGLKNAFTFLLANNTFPKDIANLIFNKIINLFFRGLGSPLQNVIFFTIFYPFRGDGEARRADPSPRGAGGSAGCGASPEGAAPLPQSPLKIENYFISNVDCGKGEKIKC